MRAERGREATDEAGSSECQEGRKAHLKSIRTCAFAMTLHVLPMEKRDYRLELSMQKRDGAFEGERDPILSVSNCGLECEYVLGSCNAKAKGKMAYLPIYFASLFENRQHCKAWQCRTRDPENRQPLRE